MRIVIDIDTDDYEVASDYAVALEGILSLSPIQTCVHVEREEKE